MLKYIMKLFINKCRHDEITPYNPSGYCSKCGALVEVNWYIIRCDCCAKKRFANLNNGVIQPVEDFCSNCGETSFSEYKLSSLNYFDIKYAVVKKEVIQSTSIKSRLQIWVDEHKSNSKQELKLLPLFK